MSTGAHRRRNLMTGEWVLVSPHRLDRPWLGETQPADSAQLKSHDAACYLCPGNTRAGGEQNPPYDATFVFDNDFAALTDESTAPAADDLLIAATAAGICRVLCYSPHHALTLARMPTAEVRRVVDLWADQYKDLAARPEIDAVTIFENRGAMMGASNPHPHGQVWATEFIPDELQKECTAQEAHFNRTGRPLLLDYLQWEIEAKERIVVENEHFLVVVPFWAVWPYETLLLPKQAFACLPELDNARRDALAAILGVLLTAYDRTFGVSAPYSMGWHQRPTRTSAPGFIAHAHFCPPLVRPPGVRKFMVGFEMFAMPQRDLTAERAAERLRAALG